MISLTDNVPIIVAKSKHTFKVLYEMWGNIIIDAGNGRLFCAKSLPEPMMIANWTNEDEFQ